MAGFLRGIGRAFSNLIPAREEEQPPARQTTGGVMTPTSSYLIPSEAVVRRGLPRGATIRDTLSSIPASRASSDSEDAEPVRGCSETRVPKIIWHADPKMLLKLRKRFYPLGLTRLTLGADLDLHTREVALKWSWKDRFLGGRLRFEGSQISLSKRFDLDLRTHMYVRAAYDIHARRTLFSLDVKPFVGFSATRDRPPGFALKQRLSVDKRVAVEFLANVRLPEARFSTSNSISLGEGDFVIDLEELNLCFMLQ